MALNKAAAWVTHVAHQLRVMKADWNAWQPLDFPQTTFTEPELQAYFEEVKMTPDEDQRVRAFLLNVKASAPEARLEWLEATYWKEHFGDRADTFKTLFDQPGRLWTFLYHRAEVEFRCSQYIEVLLFGLAAYSAEDHAVTLARLLLWERHCVHPRQTLLFEDVRSMLKRMLFYYFRDFAPQRFDNYASYNMAYMLLIEALGNHMLYHQDPHFFDEDRYERRKADGTYVVHWDVLRDDLRGRL